LVHSRGDHPRPPDHPGQQTNHHRNHATHPWRHHRGAPGWRGASRNGRILRIASLNDFSAFFVKVLLSFFFLFFLLFFLLLLLEALERRARADRAALGWHLPVGKDEHPCAPAFAVGLGVLAAARRATEAPGTTPMPFDLIP
jgi:hypothetical protein